jgi:glycosyltransferase involved in cell wall biosynthesis
MPHLKVDGPSRFAVALAKGLRRRGVDARLFVVEPGPEDGAAPAGVPVRYGAEPGTRRRRWLLKMPLRLLKGAVGASAILAANEVGEGLVAAYAAGMVTHRPTAYIAQANLREIVERFPGWHRDAAAKLYPRFDHVIAVSEGVAQTAVDTGVDPERITVIPNGVPVDEVRARARETLPPWTPAGPYVVGVGRLEDQKGFDLLIEAHARVLAEGLAHTVVLLGEGSLRGELEGRARRLGVAGSVLMPGAVDNPHPVVAGADLFCLPSRWEGWPLALTEAVILGVPVVAADCVAGPSEILEGGRYGRLVPVDDVGALTDALCAHLRDPGPLRLRAGEAAAHPEPYSIDTAV